MPSANVLGFRRVPILRLGLVALAVALAIPHNMINEGDPDDSAVYTYIGWAMAHGKVPYVQLWDHKGPLLYLIERLGACVPSPGLGCMLLDFLACAFSTWILLWILNQWVSFRTLLVLAIAFVFSAAHYGSGGNMTETWAVLFLAFAHFAALQAALARWNRYLAALAAASTAAILLIRPNMIVFAALATVYILAAAWKDRGPREFLLQLAAAVVATVTVCAAVLLPYVRMGALSAMKAAYLGYNAGYSKYISRWERIHTVHVFVVEFQEDPLLLCACFGWILLILSLRAGSRFKLTVPLGYRVLLIASTLLEMVAVMVSGRAYLHYLYVLLPTFLVVTALAVQASGIFYYTSEVRSPEVQSFGRLVFLLVILVLAQGLPLYKSELDGRRERGSEDALVTLVDRITTPADRIALIGGPETAYVYLHSQRFATSPFFYTLPIIHNALPNAAVIRGQYVADLITLRPKIIASGPTPNTGSLCQSVEECQQVNAQTNYEGYDTAILPAMIEPLLVSDYVRLKDGATPGWHIYIRRDVASANGLSIYPEMASRYP
jgi:hypothetical protein